MRPLHTAPHAVRPSLVLLPLTRVVWVVAAALVAILGTARHAEAQCPPDACNIATQSAWLGDMNNDDAVDDEDVVFFERCLLPGPLNPAGYCPAADFNFDGVVDDIDLNYLTRLVELANTSTVKKLPKVQLSEVRARKPVAQTNPGIPESRYVEVRTPLAAASLSTTRPPGSIAAPTVNGVIPGNEDVRVFNAGWYYIKVLRAIETGNPTQSNTGIIGTVVPLSGMIWVSNPLSTTTRGLGLVVDGSFAGSPVATAVPPAVAGYVTDISPASLAIPASAAGWNFNNEVSTNVTHLIVFRDPAGPRAVPAVGQQVGMPSTPTGNPCSLAWLVPGTPEKLPPWDAIADCVTIVRGTSENTWGCIFGAGLPFNIGPAAGDGFTYAPPHIYRCRNAGTWTRGALAVTATSDSPFVRNPACVTVVAGCGENNLDGSDRDCFEPQNGPGCSDADCCGAVCQVDPSCCQIAWDASCAAQAEVTCRSCGTNPASCYVAHPTPSCGDANCCTTVCSVDPFCCSASWDDSCVTLAKQKCLSCGDLNTGSCTEPHPLPYCSDPECCAIVCNIDPACCTQTWDTTCANIANAACQGCGALNSGDCCVVHATPYCKDGDCCAAVCAVDTFCCQTSWDYSCTQLANVYCTALTCNCGTGPSCFAIHGTPGCSDAFCCQTVCSHDPYCCAVDWDRACRQVAFDLCTNNPGCRDGTTGLPVLGSCYVPHPTPGCDQQGCCGQVCAIAGYAYCCQTEWDAQCVAKASEICDQCGDPLAGSCFAEHGSGNCADSTCCGIVCGIDPFCCDGVWDGLCVSLAFANCASPLQSCGGFTARSCFIPNYTPGCSDASCCTQICTNIDPFCCESRWDAVCAREAGYLCHTTFVVTVGRGACLEPHTDPGCSNADCARAVCSVEPSCCSTTWDANCVSIASAVCVAASACPTTGDCFAVSTHPGCGDSACCAGVCAADPTCCDTVWDGACVALARQLCRTPPGENWACPCVGACTEAHENPGCSDGSCCNIVCNVDPYCCEESWDGSCAQSARQYCCVGIGCGSGCNKPCLVPHDEPYCDDPYCCDAVCRADPLCCASGWDSLCVEQAILRCASACGVETAGNCFIEHERPGCRDGKCCSAVCTQDPFCCNSTWDQSCIDLADSPVNASVCKRTQCGDPNAGDACLPHDGQACKNKPCCEAVCAADPYCCETEWDGNCTDEARTFSICGCTYECGDACAGSCCRAHAGNSCDDADCCKLICGQDQYCCEVEWDSVCASMARSQCTGVNDACPVPPCGSDLLPSCCVPGLLPNCSDQGCCNAVCAVDPFCCQIQWDVACAQEAASPQFNGPCNCETEGCGDPGAGSCLVSHSTPFCSDAGCCQTVCAFDASCCTVAWDDNCVAVAEFFCGGQFAAMIQSYENGKPRAGGQAERLPPPGWVPPRSRYVPPPPPKKPLPTLPGAPRPQAPKGDLPRTTPPVEAAPAVAPPAEEPVKAPTSKKKG